MAQILTAAPGVVRKFRTALEDRPDAGQRPDEHTWSLLEYGAHLRDVCHVFRGRVRSMLLHEAPSYPDWDQNEAAAEGGYQDLDPVRVADELATAAGDLLRDAAALSGDELARTGLRSDGFEFTVQTLLQYFFHEVVHHWWDVSGERYEAGRGAVGTH